MNARRVCLALVLTVGFTATAHAGNAAPTKSGLQQALATIQQEQIADFHRRAIEEFPQADVAVAEPGFVETGLADAAIAAAEDGIRLQGQLAIWSIQEEMLADYRTGLLAQALAEVHAGLAVATAGPDTESPFGKTRSLFKSARFEWPEFMPAILR